MENNKLMKYEVKMKLFPSYFDLNDNLKPTSIMCMFQDVASQHGENIGVGFEAMLKKHLFWIITRVKYDVLKSPKLYDEVIVETWPHEKGRVDFDRDYLIKDEQGNVLIKGTSKWCVISTETRKLELPSNVNFNSDCYCKDFNYEDKFLKTPILKKEGTPSYSHKVSYNEIDHNLHLNNVHYVTYIFNALRKDDITHLQVNYISECRLDDEINVYVKPQEDNSILISGYVDDEIKFSALVK